MAAKKIYIKLSDKGIGFSTVLKEKTSWTNATEKCRQAFGGSKSVFSEALFVFEKLALTKPASISIGCNSIEINQNFLIVIFYFKVKPFPSREMRMER